MNRQCVQNKGAMMSLQALPENTATQPVTIQPAATQPAATRPAASGIGFRFGRFEGEATLDDLMSDPVMPFLWRADHLTEGDVWRLIHEVAARLHRPNPR
jgi:hypothetical protein